MGKSAVLRNYFVERRRWLLGETKYLDKMIEEWDLEGELPLDKINEGWDSAGNAARIDPKKCIHVFKKGSCEKCGIFETIAKENNVGIIKEADKPDK